VATRKTRAGRRVFRVAHPHLSATLAQFEARTTGEKIGCSGNRGGNRFHCDASISFNSSGPTGR
jgi:hypothetical protein